MVVIASKGGETFAFPGDLFNVMEMTNTHLSYSVLPQASEIERVVG